jgi:hypothetical protein
MMVLMAGLVWQSCLQAGWEVDRGINTVYFCPSSSSLCLFHCRKGDFKKSLEVLSCVALLALKKKDPPPWLFVSRATTSFNLVIRRIYWLVVLRMIVWWLALFVNAAPGSVWKGVYKLISLCRKEWDVETCRGDNWDRRDLHQSNT